MDLRSPHTFGQGNIDLPEVFSTTDKKPEEDVEVRESRGREKWREEATQYDEDGEKIPGVLDLV